MRITGPVPPTFSLGSILPSTMNSVKVHLFMMQCWGIWPARQVRTAAHVRIAKWDQNNFINAVLPSLALSSSSENRNFCCNFSRMHLVGSKMTLSQPILSGRDPIFCSVPPNTDLIRDTFLLVLNAYNVGLTWLSTGAEAMNFNQKT